MLDECRKMEDGHLLKSPNFDSPKKAKPATTPVSSSAPSTAVGLVSGVSLHLQEHQPLVALSSTPRHCERREIRGRKDGLGRWTSRLVV